MKPASHVNAANPIIFTALRSRQLFPYFVYPSCRGTQRRWRTETAAAPVLKVRMPLSVFCCVLDLVRCLRCLQPLSQWSVSVHALILLNVHPVMLSALRLVLPSWVQSTHLSSQLNRPPYFQAATALVEAWCGRRRGTSLPHSLLRDSATPQWLRTMLHFSIA
jgi:hypothetical protein